ncbi:MAG TPA: 50S ribosomal protein L11 methyltransferase [Gammaproteobacteria bacterium]|nr:50S ribosomal protein L11 methyltransferase [Gammaproteobacteria bacterium]
MVFQQIRLAISAAEYESVCETLEHLGALSITLMDAEDNPIFEPEPGMQPLWENAIVLALFDEKADLKNYAVEIIEDKNWERECMDQFHPMRFGEKLWICPSWHKINEPDAIIVDLDPGLAFGTGSHATTKLCLTWLATHNLQNKILIDYGTGSGILAISAMKLGAKKAYAVDIDTQALQAVEENALNNKVELEISTPEHLSVIQADIIIANILANPLIDLAPLLLSHLKQNGQLVLSGILVSQMDDVKHAYEPAINFDTPVVEDDWVRLSGTHSSGIITP